MIYVQPLEDYHYGADTRNEKVRLMLNFTLIVLRFAVLALLVFGATLSSFPRPCRIKMNRFFLGREIIMIMLKGRIRVLEKQASFLYGKAIRKPLSNSCHTCKSRNSR